MTVHHGQCQAATGSPLTPAEGGEPGYVRTLTGSRQGWKYLFV